MVGSDISTFPDVDWSGALIDGARALGEAVVRRLLTPRGQLIDDPDYGTDVRLFIADHRLTALQVAALVEAEAEKDERVQSAEAEVTFDAVERRISIRLALSTAEGPYRLTVSVDDLTVDLLEG